jgi:hypothetical protein
MRCRLIQAPPIHDETLHFKLKARRRALITWESRQQRNPAINLRVAKHDSVRRLHHQQGNTSHCESMKRGAGTVQFTLRVTLRKTRFMRRTS